MLKYCEVLGRHPAAPAVVTLSRHASVAPSNAPSCIAPYPLPSFTLAQMLSEALLSPRSAAHVHAAAVHVPAPHLQTPSTASLSTANTTETAAPPRAFSPATAGQIPPLAPTHGVDRDIPVVNQTDTNEDDGSATQPPRPLTQQQLRDIKHRIANAIRDRRISFQQLFVQADAGQQVPPFTFCLISLSFLFGAGCWSALVSNACRGG